MKKIFASLALIAVIISLVIAYATIAGASIRSIREELKKDSMDLSSIRTTWEEISPYLRLAVLRGDLDVIEDDLLYLERSAGTDPEIEQAMERLDRSLERLYYGFVPSFAGVF